MTETIKRERSRKEKGRGKKNIRRETKRKYEDASRDWRQTEVKMQRLDSRKQTDEWRGKRCVEKCCTQAV